MKRIIEESNEHPILKPVFGTVAEGPFYDPNDLHVHNWYFGKLGIEEDPKNPTFSKNKMSVKSCVYCKVCHKIRLDFQSSVSSNKDIVQDTLYDVFKSKFVDDYTPSTTNKIEIKIHECKNEDKVYETNINDRLFIKTEKVFDNYVMVKDSN